MSGAFVPNERGGLLCDLEANAVAIGLDGVAGLALVGHGERWRGQGTCRHGLESVEQLMQLALGKVLLAVALGVLVTEAEAP